jgi:DNA adenine methylase
VWGICSWIGGGWCAGRGPWRVEEGKLVDSRVVGCNAGQGINRKLPHLGDAGQGINRKLPHLGNAGRGINRQLPHLGDAGRGDRFEAILSAFQELSDRFRDVRVCCGDWTRVMGESVTTKHAGITGIFLDPPYADTAGRTRDIYAQDSQDVAHQVREWAVANGDNPKLRIALCGYDGEHSMPANWACIPWKTRGGYGMQGNKSGRANAGRERVWFSPACIVAEARGSERSALFEVGAE